MHYLWRQLASFVTLLHYAQRMVPYFSNPRSDLTSQEPFISGWQLSMRSDLALVCNSNALLIIMLITVSSLQLCVVTPPPPPPTCRQLRGYVLTTAIHWIPPWVSVGVRDVRCLQSVYCMIFVCPAALDTLHVLLTAPWQGTR